MNTPHYVVVQSPLAWLWQELEYRLAPEEYAELRAEWLRRYRERGKRLRGGLAASGAAAPVGSR